jgi:hypothetical protein
MPVLPRLALLEDSSEGNFGMILRLARNQPFGETYSEPQAQRPN